MQPNSFLAALTPHLTELRRRVIISLLVFVVALVSLLQFANPIYNWLTTPLLQWLPEGSQLIAIHVTAPFIVPFKLVCFLSLLITAPVLLYQIWGFILPGLYPHERKLVIPTLFFSLVLFYSGMAFAYFFVLPIIFKFFVGVTPAVVQLSTDMGAYLDFVLSLLLAFSLAFQCPIITFLLIHFNVVEQQTLCGKRPYVIVLAFAVGMLLTPPDVISQTLLAIPMWLLFELGLLLAKCFPSRRDAHLSDS